MGELILAAEAAAAFLYHALAPFAGAWVFPLAMAAGLLLLERSDR